MCTSSTSSIGSVLDSRYKYMEVLVRPGHYPGTLHYPWIPTGDGGFLQGKGITSIDRYTIVGMVLIVGISPCIYST